MSWTAEVLAQRDVWQWAPSAHNTQPGTLAADGDALIVGWDPACELPVSDPTRRDLWLSLGAFVEAVVIAAADLGIGLAVEWAVDPWANRVARLTRTAGVSTTYGGAELVGRRTARGPYRKPFVTEAEVGLLAERLAGSGCDCRCSRIGTRSVGYPRPTGGATRPPSRSPSCGAGFGWTYSTRPIAATALTPNASACPCRSPDCCVSPCQHPVGRCCPESAGRG